MFAESGIDAWLRYAALDDAVARPYRDALPAFAASFGDSPVTMMDSCTPCTPIVKSLVNSRPMVSVMFVTS